MLKHYVEDLGFRYLSASTKEEFDAVCGEFVRPGMDRPVVFECFTSAEGDRKALDVDRRKAAYADSGIVSGLKSVARNVLPSSVKGMLKAAIKG